MAFYGDELGCKNLLFQKVGKMPSLATGSLKLGSGMRKTAEQQRYTFTVNDAKLL